MYYQCYDEAVQVGLNAYRKFDYSDSCCSAFRVATRELKEYMEDMGFSYSTELASQWINSNKEHWKNHKFKGSRKAMSVLADIMEHGAVTISLQTKMERTPAYTQLPNWSRIVLDNYLASLTCSYKDSYLIQIRNSCSRFFLFLETNGINQSSEITHEIVKSFFIKDIHISSRVKDRYNNEISHCLMYMADYGLILKSIGLALNKFIIPDLTVVADLPKSEHNKFLRFFNALEEDIVSSKKEYDIAAKQLAEIHNEQKYSSFIRKMDAQATRDFRIFMDANSFAYSNDLSLNWLEYQRTKWSRVKYLAFRRVLLIINEILCTGSLSTCCFSTHEPKYLLPRWSDELLSLYLRAREREGCAISTLDTIYSSCSRFIIFLDKRGIVSETGITPEVIKDFQAHDNHRTVEGKNAYSIKVRGFLRFLAEKGLISMTLELAVSTEIAPHDSIVTTLSDKQIDAIYTFRKNIDHPMKLRNVAIIMLGLRMGLRASDIANLKLTDISWRENSISFIQQKTGVHLKLPLPVDVGNSLFRYICEGRPKSNSYHVFIHHRAPYCKFRSYTFGRILNAVVTAYCNGEAINGFHVTRKTFASKLLATGNSVTSIAAALGHVGIHTVDEYLATNEEQMRLCAIGLKGIEYSGRFSI